ncbi:MAG: lactate utilization protein [Bryobacteraceae bacterium]
MSSASREIMLGGIRAALGRTSGQAVAPVPPPRIHVPEVSLDERVRQFSQAFEKLNGKPYAAQSPDDARAYVARLLQGKSAVASGAPFLVECGIANLPGVEAPGDDRAVLRELCATRDIGITSADYALADTGSLVMISSRQEARLVSLLPPCHVAVVPRDRLLTGLDELLTILPKPAGLSSSMVLITGPSRTADIEQILVRGVHGPGEIHVVLV